MLLATKCEPSGRKLELLKDVGFKYIEVYTTKTTFTPENVRLLKSFPFEYVVHAPVDHMAIDVIDFAESINARGINVHKIIPNHRLCAMVAIANDRGMFLSVENEGFPEPECPKAKAISTFDPINVPVDWLHLRAKVPKVKLCVDIEHAIIRGVFPEMLYICAADIEHIHLTGYIDESTGHHRPIYENIEQTHKVVNILNEIGYKGFVVCEYNVKFHTKDVWSRTLKEFGSYFGVQ